MERGAKLRVVSGDRTDTFELTRDSSKELDVVVRETSMVRLGVTVITIGALATLFGLAHLAINAGDKSAISSGDAGPGIAITLAGLAVMGGGGAILAMKPLLETFQRAKPSSPASNREPSKETPPVTGASAFMPFQIGLAF